MNTVVWPAFFRCNCSQMMLSDTQLVCILPKWKTSSQILSLTHVIQVTQLASRNHLVPVSEILVLSVRIARMPTSNIAKGATDIAALHRADVQHCAGTSQEVFNESGHHC